MNSCRMLPVLALFVLGACVDGVSQEPVPTGAEDFADYCASCHGLSGKGDGEIAASLPKRPANLTTLRARAGGTFPTTKVMAKIWGYTETVGEAGTMPNFGPLLDSETVPYDGGDGIMTPTPIRLVQIAEHLKTLQPQN